MEERDYYHGKVAAATDAQRAWVRQHHAHPDEAGMAPSGDPVIGTDTVPHGQQATRETTEGVRR
jgi:hypothetical protein